MPAASDAVVWPGMKNAATDLRTLRKRAGLSQWALSALLRDLGFKASPSMLSPIERGEKECSPELRRAILRALQRAGR